ncbi:hypothetical protein [Haloarcula halophila]|uniref:hypothetical protein n=1 Tax=Haloarcula halophila TaxID=3032584 RepID=UPI0023E36BB0|nr:hypothetical protein [Halomicroarcula sp. DFY41]
MLIHRDGFDGEVLGTVTVIDDESEEIAVHPDGVPEGMQFERTNLQLMTRAENRDPPELSYFIGDRVLDEKRPGTVTGKVVEASQRAGKYRVRFGPDSGIVEREQQELSLVARRGSEA